MGMQLAIYVGGLEKTLPCVPAFARRIARLAALRRKTREFTVDGRFLDRKGLVLDTDASVSAYVHDAGDTLGVILGETAKEKSNGGTLKLRLDTAAIGRPAPREVRIHREDGSTEGLPFSARDDSVEVETRLGHWETAVVEFL